MVRHPLYDRILAEIGDLVQCVGPCASGGTGLLVALSGGPDSVALLLLATAWSRETKAVVRAGHLNHRLRGADADADEAFCEELCRRLEVPLEIHRADPRPLARQRGMGMEEAARHLRFEFLGRLLDQNPELRCAATGHHRDDQTETVIMRLFRGTGLDGLAGIRPVSGRIIHPLLRTSRREILAFLETAGQSYRLDATNESGDQTRNRVRRQLLPLVRDIFGGGAEDGPARLARLAAAETALLDRLAHRELVPLLVPTPGATDGGPGAEAPGPTRLRLQPLRELDPVMASRLLRLVFKAHDPLASDLGQTHLENLLRWLRDCRSGSSVDLPHGWKVSREFDHLCLFPPGPGSRPAPGDPAPGLSTGLSYRILVLDENGPPPDSADSPAPGAATGGTAPVQWRIQCPREAIHGRLRLRHWHQGDRIDLLGLGGRKKISDLLRERRIGLSERPRVMVLEDDVGILWVVGLARSERTRLLPTSASKVTIAVIPADNSLAQPPEAKGPNRS